MKTKFDANTSASKNEAPGNLVPRVFSLSQGKDPGNEVGAPGCSQDLLWTFLLRTCKAGVHLKAVFWLGIMFLMQISRLRFKQSRISMLISHIYVLGRFVNFFGDF